MQAVRWFPRRANPWWVQVAPPYNCLSSSVSLPFLRRSWENPRTPKGSHRPVDRISPRPFRCSTMESQQEAWSTIGCSNHPHVFFHSTRSSCRDVAADQQHSRLLLCVARQDDDTWSRWRRRAFSYRCKCNDRAGSAGIDDRVEIREILISFI